MMSRFYEPQLCTFPQPFCYAYLNPVDRYSSSPRDQRYCITFTTAALHTGTHGAELYPWLRFHELP